MSKEWAKAACASSEFSTKGDSPYWRLTSLSRLRSSFERDAYAAGSDVGVADWLL
ncbi:MAG: hypothetical protein N3D12_05405 [Candidatus Methanomethyliaceae archaeon]|nr:hypothetical protein [Candidatus Methanomethyliaceae archaeon]